MSGLRLGYSFAVSALLTLTPASVGAQVCGDADASGGVSVTDGVAVLRTAAELPSVCAGRVCDVDGSGTVSVSDGVGTLRHAAQLPTILSCGTRFGELVKTIRTERGTADLQLGQPPAPGDGAEVAVASIDGAGTVESGAQARVIVRLLGAVDTLLIAFRENGAFVDGFAVLRLLASPGAEPAGEDGSLDLTLDIGDVPAGTTGELSVGTMADGAVGGFRSEPLTVIAANAPVISDVSVTLAQLNDASTCAVAPFSPTRPGSRFTVDLAYIDPNGDATDATTRMFDTFRFRPSGNQATIELGRRTVTGDGSSGRIDALVCYGFGSDTTVDSVVSIEDAAGNRSNEVVVTTGKPAGAN